MNSKKSENRRNFIKKGLAGAAGLSVLPSLNAISPSRKFQHNLSEPENKIVYRTLGRTGYKLPIVSMGTSSNEYLIKAGLRAGIVHFDTANSYGKGLDEITMGRALRGVSRESFVLATKIQGMRDNSTGLLPAGCTAEEYKSDFRKKMEESMRRLQLEYVDILYLHAVDNPELLKEKAIKEVMLELKAEGRTKFLGVSTHTSSVIPAIVEQEIYDVVLVAHNFREEDPQITKKAIKQAVDAGCGIVGMKSLAGVYWDEERKLPVNAQAALKWLIRDENIHTTIITMNTFDQLEKYMAVMNNLTLSQEEIKDLRLDEKDDTVGLYCTQCGQCLPLCPYKLDIPKVMRSYMYAYAYRKPAKAKETMELLGTNTLKCTICPECTAICPMGFDIKRKASDIARIMNIPDEFLV